MVLVEAKSFHGARVLRLLSEEEAAKYLILIDALRCPRQPVTPFVAQLSRFGDHLAKGLYAVSCWLRPESLGQLQEYLDTYRENFYLDGPNDVDWIFRNDIIREREEALYVDYVAYDGHHSWFDPGIYDDSAFEDVEPLALQVAGSLYDVGISKPAALAAIAEVWRTVAMLPETHCIEIRKLNARTLECLNQKGLLQERPDSDYQRIVDRWQFPLYTLNLSLLDVGIEALRDRQRLWFPEW